MGTRFNTTYAYSALETRGNEMKLEEYSESVMNKAVGLLKSKHVVLEYPLTRKQMLVEESQWRFMVLYGKDNGKTGGYYVDKNGDYGNHVMYIMRKELWVCTCLHYIHSLDENCKHVCSAKLLMKKEIKNAEGLNEKDKHEQGSKGSDSDGSGKEKPVDSTSKGDNEMLPSSIEQTFRR